MHICFITHEYPKKGSTQGGIGSVVQTIAKALQEKGHTVSVVGIGNYEESFEEDNGVKIYRLQRAKWKIANFIPNTRKVLSKLQQINEEYSIDVIEGAELDFAFFPRNFYAKKVIRMHGGHRYFAESMGKKPSPWRSFQETISFNKADALLAVSHYVGEKTKELVQYKKDFVTIYNIIDTNEFFLADTKKVENKKIVFVGTVTEKKGVRQLVQAMPKIVAKYPEARLEIIGRDSSHPETGHSYIEYLKTFIDENVKNNITIVGPLPHTEIPCRLESAEVCTYPSHMEAMPIAWLEALGMGKSVVASILGPGPEAIKDKETGLLCDPYNPDDIAEKILYMFDNPEEAKIMGKNARQDILSRFDPEVIISKNIEFYKAQL